MDICNRAHEHTLLYSAPLASSHLNWKENMFYYNAEFREINVYNDFDLLTDVIH